MKVLMVLFCLLPWSAFAGTLYQWTDASGEVRYGYRPPLGVKAAVADDSLKKLRESGGPISCQQLADEHLRLVDKEIARVKAQEAGFGPAFEFTPLAKQELINDLLAHRAALITGRLPEEFMPAGGQRELGELKAKFEREKAQMQETLQQQANEIQKQRLQLERERREAELIMQQYRAWRQGIIPPRHP